LAPAPPAGVMKLLVNMLFFPLFEVAAVDYPPGTIN